MSFNTFCNICFIKEHIIKLCVAENERIFKILISFTSCRDIVNGNIYLCVNCCNKLEEYDKFRELFLTNFVRFRYLYNEHKKQLEIRNAPDIEAQLKKFVDINVERSSGTPLIENYEVISFRQINNTLENGTQTCHDSYTEDQKNIYGSSITANSEPSVFDEPYNEFINTDFVGISFPCSSLAYKENCNLPFEQKLFKIEDTSLEKDEPNPDRFEESHDQFVSDSVPNVIPCRKSAENVIRDLSTNSENCTADDIKNEEGEPSSFEETCSEFTNTNTVVTSSICSSSVYNENCNLPIAQIFFKKEDIISEEDEPNPDRLEESQEKFVSDSVPNVIPCRKSDNDICELSTNPENCTLADIKDEEDDRNSDLFEESHEQLVSDTVANILPCRKSADDDILDLSTNHENCITDDNTNNKEPTGEGNKPTKIDTVCIVCNKRFSCSNNLEVHMRTHSGVRPYNCDKCNKTFTRNFHLIEHKRIHTGKKPYKCDGCGLGFTKSGDLNRHKRTHTGERPYPCDECHKFFTKRSSLVEHKLIHTGEKPYKCDECGSGFRQSSKLKTHKRTHTGERPYPCDECHKSFTKRCNLLEHKLIHSGEKPYKCDECGLRFTQRSNLNKHKRIHTGERPYPCDECHKKFTDTSNLSRHKRTHRNKKP